MDDLVTFFENRNIPLALNHCVSLYPTEDADLELNQIVGQAHPSLLPGQTMQLRCSRPADANTNQCELQVKHVSGQFNSRE